LLTAVHSLRQLDRLIATAAADLGAREGTQVPNATADAGSTAPR